MWRPLCHWPDSQLHMGILPSRSAPSPRPQVESKTIPQIAVELARLQQLAAAGKLQPQDLTGGSLTISNIGARPRPPP